MARLTRSVLASVAAFSLVLSAGAALATPEDDLRRIEELKECIDRNDALRGQDAAWRESHCPDTLEAAKAQLAKLLDEQQERVKKAAAKAKKDVQQAAAAQEEKVASGGGSSASGKAGQSGSQRAAAAPLAAPGLTFPASDPTLQAPSLAPPCAPPSAPDLGAGGATPLPGFGTLPPLNPELVTWGVQQVDAMCGRLLGLLGGLPQLPDLPSVQAELQAPTALDVDKQVNLSDLVQPFGPDEVFFYDIFITNNTMTNASGTLTDDIPNELENIFVIENDPYLSCSGDDIVSCTITDLPPTTTEVPSAYFYVGVQVPDDYCENNTPSATPIVNTATTSQMSVPVGGDSITSYIVCAPLNIEKEAKFEDETRTPEGGDTFLYDITVTNDSETETFTGFLDDDIPAPPFVITGPPDDSNMACDPLAGAYLSCDFELDPGETASVEIPMAIPEDYCNPRGVQNTTQVYATIEDQGFVVDRDTIFTEVACAELGIKKTADEETYSTGEIVTYTIDITNFGPATAHDVEVTDFHPPGFEFLDATTTHGSCGNEGDHVLCTLGDLDLDEKATITIRYRITGDAPCDEDGTTKNRADVTASNQGSSKDEPCTFCRGQEARSGGLERRRGRLTSSRLERGHRGREGRRCP